jgi:branched-chain amino acid transport system substrate-binding protein
MAPFSGVAAGFGQDMLKGAQMAVEEANGSGGKRFVLDQGDDAADPAVAPGVAQKLISDGVVAMIGPATSASALAAEQALNQAKIPTILPAANDPRITDQRLPFVFRATGRWDQEPAVLAPSLAKVKAAIMADRSAYGQSLAAAMRQALSAAGTQPVDDETVDSGTKDFGPVVDKLKGSSAEAIFYAGYAQDGASLAKAARAAGLGAQLAMGDAAQDQALIAGGGSAVDGLRFAAAPDPAEAAPVFADAFKKRYGTAASVYAASTYDAVRLLASAVGQANSLDGEAVRKAVAGSAFNGAYWGRMTFDDKGDLQGKTYVPWTVNGGKFVTEGG